VAFFICVFRLILRQYPSRQRQTRLPLLRLLASQGRSRTACRAGRIGGIGDANQKEPVE